jgi:hypothetical protein
MSLAQINIGLYMGAMLDKERLWKTLELLPYILGGTAAMIGVSVVVAKFLAGHYHFSLVAAFLGMAPGGIAEMCLAGYEHGRGRVHDPDLPDRAGHGAEHNGALRPASGILTRITRGKRAGCRV